MEELFSGFFMGYDPSKLEFLDRRIACSVIARRVKTYAKVVAYLQEKIKENEMLTLESVLLTSEHDYVYARQINASKVTIFCGNKEHPSWTIGTDSLLEKRSWCGHCRKSVRKTSAQVQRELESRGLRLKSLYKNANKAITIECQNGHTSTLTLSKIVNGHVGCPLCYAPREEAIVRHYLEYLLGIRFDQVRKRPSWLHKIAGIRLELDGFCSNHLIAFEYQGEHHYKQVGYCLTNLEKVQARDAAKLAACIVAGVRLLVVPTLPKNWSVAQAGEHVLNVLSKAGLRPVLTLNQIPRFVKLEPEKLATLRAAIKAKGGILLEPSYNGYHRPHLVQCGCGNKWGSSPASIFRGCWCPKCGRRKKSKSNQE